MKKHRGSLVILLAALMLLTLCSCSEKVKPEKIDTKDFNRDILVEAPVDGLEVVHADKSTQSLQPGDKLKSDDGIRVGSGGELVLSDRVRLLPPGMSARFSWPRRPLHPA